MLCPWLHCTNAKRQKIQDSVSAPASFCHSLHVLNSEAITWDVCIFVFLFFFNVMFISKQTIATIVPSWYSCLIHCAFKCLCLCLGVPYTMPCQSSKNPDLNFGWPLIFQGHFSSVLSLFFCYRCWLHIMSRKRLSKGTQLTAAESCSCFGS